MALQLILLGTTLATKNSTTTKTRVVVDNGKHHTVRSIMTYSTKKANIQNFQLCIKQQSYYSLQHGTIILPYDVLHSFC